MFTPQTLRVAMAPPYPKLTTLSHIWNPPCTSRVIRKRFVVEFDHFPLNYLTFLPNVNIDTKIVVTHDDVEELHDDFPFPPPPTPHPDIIINFLFPNTINYSNFPQWWLHLRCGLQSPWKKFNLCLRVVIWGLRLWLRIFYLHFEFDPRFDEINDALERERGLGIQSFKHFSRNLFLYFIWFWWFLVAINYNFNFEMIAHGFKPPQILFLKS